MIENDGAHEQLHIQHLSLSFQLGIHTKYTVPTYIYKYMALWMWLIILNNSEV